MADYSINNDYVHVGGASPVPKAIDDWARQWATDHYLIAFAWMIFGVCVLVYWLYKWSMGEGMSPGATMRHQMLDGGYPGSQSNKSSSENLAAAPDRSGSAFAQLVQTPSGTVLVGPAGAGSTPGTLSYQVLHSSDFNCDNRVAAPSNAWDWMTKVAGENLTVAPGAHDDNALSKVASGM